MIFQLEKELVILTEDMNLPAVYDAIMSTGKYIPFAIKKEPRLDEAMSEQFGKKVIGTLYNIYYPENFIA